MLSGMSSLGAGCSPLAVVTTSNNTLNFFIWQAVVPRMAHRDEQIAAQCCSAVRALLSGEDKSGGATAREAVQLVADLVKRRKCQCNPAVVDALLGIKFAPTDVVQPSGPGSNPSQCSSFFLKTYCGSCMLFMCPACSLLYNSLFRQVSMSSVLFITQASRPTVLSVPPLSSTCCPIESDTPNGSGRDARDGMRPHGHGFTV
jgi:hypothetical protein